MREILIICHLDALQLWEKELFERLEQSGYKFSLRNADSPRSTARFFNSLLWLESLRFGASLAAKVALQHGAFNWPQLNDSGHAAKQHRKHGSIEPNKSRSALGAGNDRSLNSSSDNLVIDLTGKAVGQGAPVLTIEFLGHHDFSAGLGQMLSADRAMEIVTRLDGVAVGRARPMLGDRLWMSRASNEMLAGAISLVVQSVERYNSGLLRSIDPTVLESKTNTGFWAAYLRSTLGQVVGRVQKRMRLGRRPFYWQVAYRQLDGPGIAESGKLDGPAFQILPDDKSRFYADPFLLEHEDRHYLFVEEFPYELGKGIISLAEFIDGQFSTPRVIITEPHHLSYPQLFKLDGEFFMIPESSAARMLVLYRAERFPDCWVRDTVLLEDIDFNDATLLERDGRFWLFGTQRFGRGSASDTMTVFSSASIRGPWLPHARNPITIDHSAARPGGAFIQQRGSFVLPVQDGSHRYGGGLGLMELIRLDDEEIIFSQPIPIQPGNAWAVSGIHTLNRSGKLEVVDSAG